MHRFGPEQSKRESIAPEELHALLHRLHADEYEQALEDGPDDHATVSAVCEVTGHSPQRVLQILEDIRREDRESRVAERLREIEEPLYRVERPGADTDPLNKPTFANRQRVFQSILDTVPRPEGKIKVNRKEQVTAQDKLSSWIGMIVVLLVLALTLGLITASIAGIYR